MDFDMAILRGLKLDTECGEARGHIVARLDQMMFIFCVWTFVILVSGGGGGGEGVVMLSSRLDRIIFLPHTKKKLTQ